MDTPSPDGLHEALRPIASLISKSEKAQQKLVPGAWQHTMLQANLQALHLAFALLNNQPEAMNGLTEEDVNNALAALASMIKKAEHTEAAFAPGTSQHSLQRNRLKALRVAEALMQKVRG